MTNNTVFFENVDKMQGHLDSFIVDGTDQELFIASYLHGHFDVAVAQTEKKIETQEITPDAALQNLHDSLHLALDNAFASNELSDSDASQVRELLTNMF
jgi:hypothetical protein